MQSNQKETAQRPKSLVLVVGAGASKEVSLPTGDELKQSIARVLDFRVEFGTRVVGGDPHVRDAVLQLAQRPDRREVGVDAYLQAARLICDAMPQAQSIDNFIDSHRDNVLVAEVGKLAIAFCILKAEESSLLRVDRSNIYNKIDFAQVAHTWFNGLFRLIAANCGREDLQARFEKVAVISFNYDRCVEHFLHESLSNYYAMSRKQAAALLSYLDVYHPYGTVGRLSWATDASSIEYGAQPHSGQLYELASRLRTFTEGTDEQGSEIVAIRSTLRSAERVVFLGFAFHPLNMDLLYGTGDMPVAKRAAPVFATARGLSESDVQFVKIDLMRAGHEATGIHLRRDLHAATLLTEYGRSLSLR